MERTADTPPVPEEDEPIPFINNRLFVEFYIPPPPSETTDTESSESDSTTQDSGFEINGLNSTMNIFDVSERIINGSSHNKGKSRKGGDASRVIDLRRVIDESQDSPTDSDSSGAEAEKDKQSRVAHPEPWSSAQQTNPSIPNPTMRKTNRNKSFAPRRAFSADAVTDSSTSVVTIPQPSSLPDSAADHALDSPPQPPKKDTPEGKKLSPIPEVISPQSVQNEASVEKSSEVVLVHSSPEKMPPLSPKRSRSPFHSPNQSEEHSPQPTHRSHSSSRSPQSEEHSPRSQEHISLSQRIMSPRIDSSELHAHHLLHDSSLGFVHGLPLGIDDTMYRGHPSTSMISPLTPRDSVHDDGDTGVVVRMRNYNQENNAMSTTPLPDGLELSDNESQWSFHQASRLSDSPLPHDSLASHNGTLSSGEMTPTPSPSRVLDDKPARDYPPTPFSGGRSDDARPHPPLTHSFSEGDKLPQEHPRRFSRSGRLSYPMMSPLLLSHEESGRSRASDKEADVKEEEEEEEAGGEKKLRRVGRFGKSSLIEDVRERQ